MTDPSVTPAVQFTKAEYADPGAATARTSAMAAMHEASKRVGRLKVGELAGRIFPCPQSTRECDSASSADPP